MQTRYLEDSRVVRGHLETDDNLVIAVMSDDTHGIKTSSEVGRRSLNTHWTGFVIVVLG